MDDLPPDGEPAPRSRIGPRIIALPSLVLSLFLVAAVIVYDGYHAWIAFDPDDTNHLETPLALAVAREVADGPSSLYGPFSGEHPLVLIHAPLYYRLAGLLAWPIAKAGVSPILAALIAGRSLAFLGLVLLLFAAWRVATCDGAPRLAGFWAALLIASSPVFGSFGFTVRPDTLGIAFQTLGFALTMRALNPLPTSALERAPISPSRRLLSMAGIMFGLAMCAKQHLVVAAGVAAFLILIEVFRGRLRVGAALLWLVMVIGIPAVYYGWEQYVTGGRMSESVLTLPSRLRTLAPASWEHVGTVFLTVLKMAVGLIALSIGAVLISPRRALLGTKLDGALWMVLIAELAAMIPLCLGSTGAWVNYAMPAAVWASILLARGLVRVLEAPSLGVFRAGMLFAAAFLLFANDARLAATSYSARRDGRELIAQVLTDPTVAAAPRTSRYFVGMPQLNRLYGRVDLAHDEWLYKSYEATGLAEPRSRWLLEALTKRGGPGPVTIVVVPSDTRRGDFVHGIDASLPHLGYRNIQQYGRFAVWARSPDS